MPRRKCQQTITRSCKITIRLNQSSQQFHRKKKNIGIYNCRFNRGASSSCPNNWCCKPDMKIEDSTVAVQGFRMQERQKEVKKDQKWRTADGTLVVPFQFNFFLMHWLKFILKLNLLYHPPIHPSSTPKQKFAWGNVFSVFGRKLGHVMASLIGFERYIKDTENLKIVQTFTASIKSKMLAARIPSQFNFYN